MLKLTNTLSSSKEEFKPINSKKVGMYNCGPTVYDYAHIGNLRSYVFADVLRRTLELNGYKVDQVINITDIGHLASDADDGEDKMTKGLKREGKALTLENMKWLADTYTEHFKQDLRELNIELPTHLPKASDHIKEDIELVKKLEEKGFVYRTSDGMYFDTAKDPDYGKLGKVHLKTDESESRIGINSEKKNPKDFAVWKFNPNLGYESPWGKGFPGWHIECSAMSMKYLGETFDIHTGGIDHIPIHHNNEIAQSESATGKTYVNYWLHNAFVNVDGSKMAKSAGNFLKLKDLHQELPNRTQKYSAILYRYYLLLSHYRTPTVFNIEAYKKLSETLDNILRYYLDFGEEIGIPSLDFINKFKENINDDLNTPKALADLFALFRDSSISSADKKATMLKFDEVLGLDLHNLSETERDNIIVKDIPAIEAPEEVQKLVIERANARLHKDFKKSDELRSEIDKLGYIVKDTPDGQKISRK